MDDGYIDSIWAESGAGRYPAEFLNDYEPFECLAHSDECETLLVKNKRTGLFYVAKCYTDRESIAHTTEADILKKLKYCGLPRFASEYRNEQMLCVVREYVEGTPLDRYAGQNELTEKRIVALAVELCDLLTYLHGQDPPVIHRDIKPQNLIVDPYGKLWLIDFGISREYNRETAEDTVCYGTRNFAAPEQYGFAQTDGRADLFSLGILLGWLLTGETKREAMLPEIANRRLRRVVEKCTAFAPQSRYAAAAKVRADLLASDGRAARRCAARALLALALVFCLCAGFAVGRYTGWAQRLSLRPGVTFEEPLVERAVRLRLGVGENEPLTETELLNITDLFIYGNQAVGDAVSYGELGERMADNDGSLQNGGMTSLADILKLPNLAYLHVALENITDLSPLAGATALTLLDVRHNPVTDVSPLAGLPVLREVCLFGTRVADCTALAACPLLQNVEAGGTYVTSPAAFEGLNGLTRLGLTKAPVQTLAGVESLQRLEYVAVSEVADGDLTPLLSLPALKTVTLSETLRQAAEETLSEAGFAVEYR